VITADSAVRVTFFQDWAAQSKTERGMSLGDLAAEIRDTNRDGVDLEHAKASLPWLKMARFGHAKTAHGSLRHDRNVIAITGIEADYDGEKIDFDAAAEIALKGNLGCLLYCSPSYSSDCWRWRILCPTSTEVPPERRAQLVSRVNGLFGDVFARESWVVSQSYYYGSANRNPLHRVEIIEGEAVDALDELDLVAIGQPQIGAKRTTRRTNGAAGPHGHRPSPSGPAAETLDVIAALSIIDNNERDWERWSYIALAVHAATSGSAAGQAAFFAWSEQAGEDIFSATTTMRRWEEICTSPPRGDVGAGTLFRLAREAWPTFERPSALRRRRDNDPGEPPPGFDEPVGSASNPTSATQPSPANSRIVTGDAFVGAFEPPDWLIAGIVQKGRLYSCTSVTAHGKTAVWLYFACMVHAGRMAGGLETEKGAVLYLAGENPQDLCARMLGMAQRFGIPSLDLPYVLPRAFPLDAEEAEHLKREIRDLGVPLVLVVGDTAASFHPGPDENDNLIARDYARTLRSLTELPGSPAVVVLAHPTKAADQDTLLPRGGGAFLNELDANLTLWSPELGERTILHWQGKIRGPDFEPQTFKLVPQSTGVRDRKGRDVMTIVARPMDEVEAADQTKQNIAGEDYVLRAHFHHPAASFAEIARILGWSNDEGVPSKEKVHRAVKILATAKLLAQLAPNRPYAITERGIEYLRKTGLIPNDLG
jgi:AAA domain/Primase C terminal 2 (PriCT-2)